MEKTTVKIGCKFGTEHFQVELPLELPENVDEMIAVSEGQADFVTKCFNRGYRIWRQEQSGARDFVAASTVTQRTAAGFPEAVRKVMMDAKPSQPPKRSGRPAKPQEVTITAEQVKALKGDPAKFAELLAAQGIKVNIG